MHMLYFNTEMYMQMCTRADLYINLRPFLPIISIYIYVCSVGVNIAY